MKRWFERQPIHRKLVASGLFITALGLVVALLGLSAFDAWRYRAAAADDAAALASILAENTAAAVVLNQAAAAAETVRSVRVRDVVTMVCVFLPDGRLFAEYTRTADACPADPAESAWTGVLGRAPIMRNGRLHGFVYVERNLADLRGRVLLTAFAGFALFALAALAAYLLAQPLSAAIARPITDLARQVRSFGSEAGSGSPPRPPTAPDELGELVAAFSEMTARVRIANDELRRSTDALRREEAEREAALRRELESERRFKTLADGSPVLLWVNGPEGCEFVNRAYLDFVGSVSEAEVRGYDWSRFVHPDDRDTYMNGYLEAFRSRAPFGAEFRFRRSDGEWRWMRSEATPRVQDDAFVGYVGATVDITDRRTADEELKQADRRKTAFLAVLAHELRNPLAPIRAGLELLRLGGATPGTLERIRPVLERQVSHMVRLIDDLLDMSRITSGKIQLQRQLTPLRDLVHNAVDAHRAAIDAAGLRLSVSLPDAPCILDVDPTRFVQVLSNLLHNATKFTPRGGAVDVDAVIDDHTSPPLLLLRIADSGVGIPETMLPHVFEFFTQGETGHRKASGLGIGLALARQLVEMHGGSIEARSGGTNRGSVFSIRLPAFTVPSVSSPSEADQPHAKPCVGLRVLVIDDNADAADTLSAVVTTLGGIVRTAYDGRSGLRQAAEFRPDVVLLDIGMPDVDGYETCRLLRGEQVGLNVYVVAVTGWGQLHDRERAFSEGFDAHLTKPADPRTLEALLVDASLYALRSEAGESG
jgi:PAS domain S-box-containing protein